MKINKTTKQMIDKLGDHNWCYYKYADGGQCGNKTEYYVWSRHSWQDKCVCNLHLLLVLAEADSVVPIGKYEKV